MKPRLAWIRHGALGDIVVALSALVQAHEFFPEHAVEIVGPKLWCDLIDPRLWPRVSCIWVTPRRGGAAERYVPSQDQHGSWDLAATRQTLATGLRGVDTTVDLRLDSMRFGIEAWKAGVRRRIGALPPPQSWVLTDPLPWFPKDPVIHERDLALAVLDLWKARQSEVLKPSWRERLWPKPLDGEMVSRLSAKLRSEHRGLPMLMDLEPQKSRAGIYINPTSSRREKAWPAAHFTDLIRRLLEGQPERVSILGAPHETAWLQEVRADLPVEVVQPAGMRDLLAELARARLLVANTSSLQFLAATTLTPVVTLMGRASPAIWGPLGPHDAVVQARAPQSWCSDDIFAQEVEAYSRIGVNEVIAAIDQALLV